MLEPVFVEKKLRHHQIQLTIDLIRLVSVVQLFYEHTQESCQKNRAAPSDPQVAKQQKQQDADQSMKCYICRMITNCVETPELIL